MEGATEIETECFRAKLAEQTEMFEVMRASMKKVTLLKRVLSAEERNMLSVSYKNIVGARRAAWRVLSSFESRERKKPELVKRYKGIIERELEDVCRDIITLLDDVLLHADVSHLLQPKAKLFYYKMKGDYYRYLAEFLVDDTKRDAMEKALTAYEKATTCGAELPPTNPVKLGLALNFSVFYYEILHKPEDARRVAKSTFDAAVAVLGDLPEDEYKDATLVLQLLRDNIALWEAEEEQVADSSARRRKKE
eukprot:g5105.t1